ncbi:hypothetical protein ACTQ34_17975, partial [Agathobaculum sp. LCP25S3_E8]|uniref:hypothetical protein n=1 Tax=Agathobaculum sp. LCP25S3_E8 TaxID=3438735 RepID=UPI003F91F5BA
FLKFFAVTFHCDPLRLCSFSLTDFWGICDCTYRVLLQVILKNQNSNQKHGTAAHNLFQGEVAKQEHPKYNPLLSLRCRSGIALCEIECGGDEKCTSCWAL